MMTEEQKQRLESVTYVHSEEEEKAYNDRLKELGIKTNYQSHRIWTEKRKQFKKELPYICFVCGKDSNLHLHHKSYKNIGRETNNDVCWLCKSCHVKAHKNVHRKNGEKGNSSYHLIDDYVWERIQFGARANGYKLRGRNNWQHYLLELAEDSLTELS